MLRGLLRPSIAVSLCTRKRQWLMGVVAGGGGALAVQDHWGVSVSRDQKKETGTGIILTVLCASLRLNE